MGSTRTRSKSTAAIPAARSASKAIAIASLRANCGSVTTITLLPPRRAISWPTSRVDPAPTVRLEASVV